jgi:hypothetical protein
MQENQKSFAIRALSLDEKNITVESLTRVFPSQYDFLCVHFNISYSCN